MEGVWYSHREGIGFGFASKFDGDFVVDKKWYDVARGEDFICDCCEQNFPIKELASNYSDNYELCNDCNEHMYGKKYVP